VFASLCLFGGGRRRTAMLTFGVTVCTAGLTGVELYYHYLKPQPLTVEDRFDGELDEPDQRHTLRYIAGAVGHRKRTLDGELELETFYNIDQDRARAVPGRPALGPKWYFFGCSYTFGFSVSDDQTLPALMQARRPHTRVYNYGVNGYGTADVYLYLRDRVRGQEQLGLCVYFMIDHHLERTACTDALLSSDWGKEKPRFRLDGGRLHHEGRAYETLSPLRRLHVNTLARSHLYRRAHQSLATPWSAGDQVLDLAETLIAGMATACPGRFALVLLPEHVGGATEPIDLKLWQSKLQRRGVLVLDLRERFHEHVAVEGSTASDYFYSDNHPRPRFDQLMANWLDDYLRQNA
jgi:hypothetical protein